MYPSFYWVQISEVVNSMKDLIDFSRDNSVGPTGTHSLLSVNTNSAFLSLSLRLLVSLFVPIANLYYCSII